MIDIDQGLTSNAFMEVKQDIMYRFYIEEYWIVYYYYNGKYLLQLNLYTDYPNYIEKYKKAKSGWRKINYYKEGDIEFKKYMPPFEDILMESKL